MKIRFHFNKQSAAKGKPWTLHTSKACLLARNVVFRTVVQTENRPDKKTNPRYFLVADGRIEWDGDTATVLPK